MQNDITDGVQHLIEQGIADPKRIGIYGGSYGGYATLAALTFTPDVYACGVDYVGVSNLFTFIESIPPYWKPYLEQLYAMVGHPEIDAEMLRAASPVFHVDKIRVPLLIAQGANDPRVNKTNPIKWSPRSKPKASKCLTSSKITKDTAFTTKKIASTFIARWNSFR
jgi:dipeptidyl aminopeptidase/acylaminoacyl peptidase